MIRDFTNTPEFENVLLRGLEALSRTVETILARHPLPRRPWPTRKRKPPTITSKTPNWFAKLRRSDWPARLNHFRDFCQGIIPSVRLANLRKGLRCLAGEPQPLRLGRGVHREKFHSTKAGKSKSVQK